jgi:acetolactate synthase-1/3 small subunit
LTLEITGAEEKIDGLLELLRPYGVLEMVRTGIVAMRRGSKSAASTRTENTMDDAPDGVAYSV